MWHTEYFVTPGSDGNESREVTGDAERLQVAYFACLSVTHHASTLPCFAVFPTDFGGKEIAHKDCSTVRPVSSDSLPSPPFLIFHITSRFICCIIRWWQESLRLLVMNMYLALINRAGGIVWENIARGRKYRPNAVRSVHTSEVKILPYSPTSARLIRCLL